MILCAYASWAQSGDPFSIRVESNQVLVRAEVYKKGARHSHRSENYWNCMRANRLLSWKLPMTAPYIGDEDCLEEVAVKDLKARDFHIVEDGVEQKISSVVLERVPSTLERDMHNERLSSHIPNNGFVEYHSIWSYTARGIWRSTDLPSTWCFSAVYYYRIAYVPQKLEAGKCHRVKVKVDRPHTEVMATDQYCYIPHSATDVLAGTEFGRSIKAELSSHFVDPEIPLLAQAGFFYSDRDTAKANIVLRFPFEKLKHHWSDGDLHGNIGVLGIAYAAGGTAVAQFSDAAIMRGDMKWWSNDSATIGDLPSRYETQMDLGPGYYELRIVLSDGSKFGRVIVPIEVAELRDTGLTLSSLFLFKRFRNAAVMAREAKKANLAPAYVPLVSQEIAVTPTAEPTFHAKETLPVYFEVYETAAAQTSELTVQVHMRIVDTKSGEAKQTFPWFDAEPYRRAGTKKFAIHKFLYYGDLAPGKYRLEAQARDSLGDTSSWRGTEFSIE